jgi:ribonuclease VapC
MIAVDTSALMAIVLDEAEAGTCIAVLEKEDNVLISAGTIAEALIVGARRNVSAEIESMIDGLGFTAVAVTPASARRIASAYACWGKGIHAAGLNFGDCFAYEVARENDCPLLYVGGDFARTDVKRAL